MERFAFSLKYMHEMQGRPENFEDEVLRLLYDAAEFANMDIDQQTKYESIMRNELDICAEKDYAFCEGEAKGLARGRAEGETNKAKEVARNFLAMGLSVKQVAQGTGLSEEEIKKLKN